MTCTHSMGRARASLLRRAGTGVVLGLLLVAFSSSVSAEPFLFSGKPIHPGCVHALVMASGDAIPVTTAISLEGCMASGRSKAAVTSEGGLHAITDDELLGSGSFAYRQLASLDNGLIILGIRRTDGEGVEKVSLAVVDLADRPSLRHREVMQRKWLEMIGEVWVKNLQMASLRTVGNVVHFAAGVGNTRTDQRVDFSRIGKARDRKK